MTVFDTGILVHQENGDFRALFSEPKFQVKELEEMFPARPQPSAVYILLKRCMEEQQVETLGSISQNLARKRLNKQGFE